MLDTILTFIGGLLVGMFGFAQFLIKRHDAKHDGMKNLGEKIDVLTSLVESQSKKQEETQDEIKLHGEAIAGLEHDRIIRIGENVIQRGEISLSEYDDIEKYLYKPYKKLGGNGTAESVMERLRELVSK